MPYRLATPQACRRYKRGPWRLSTHRTWALVWGTLALAACRPAPDSPQSVLEGFLADLEYGRAQSAWKRLAPDSQAWLETRWLELRRAEAPDREPKAPEPGALLFDLLDLTLLQAPESVAVVSPPGDRVTLRVSVEGGRSAEVRLVRHDDRWKVDLVSTLQLDRSPTGPDPGG
jgi:hypothetical protein